MRLARLLAARAAQALVVVFVVATITFFLIRLAPGDPFSQVLDNPNITEAVREQWRRTYGFDRSLPAQYLSYLGALARGDFGWSFSTQRPVREAIAGALPYTVLLAGTALLLSFVFGVALAVAQARRPGSALDRAISGISLFFYSIPDFWLALVLLLVFALGLGVLPAGGAGDPIFHDRMSAWGRIVDTARHLALPLTALTLLGTSAVARYQRAALLDVLPRDFMRTAEAKGMSRSSAIATHGLRNALLPTITLVGLSIPALIGGAVFVEKIFAWPGMGLLALNAVAARDYALVVAVAIVAGIAVVLGNLLADLLYVAADPRLRER